MKKILAVSLAVAAAVSIGACSSHGADNITDGNVVANDEGADGNAAALNDSSLHLAEAGNSADGAGAPANAN